MMTFYSAAGSCAFASHVALEETGAEYCYVRLNMADSEQNHANYLKINPRGRVPALAVQDRVITETIAILTYLANRYPEAALLPLGDQARLARAYELMAWFASSIHVSFSQIFRGQRFTHDAVAIDALKSDGRTIIVEKFDELEALAGQSRWLLGDAFSVVDAYLTVFWRWGPRLQIDMGDYPAWSDHATRVLDRQSAKRVVAFEQRAIASAA